MRRTGKRQELSRWRIYYNDHRTGMNFEQRMRTLMRIERAAVELEITTRTRPSDVVRKMKAAHAALVKYVESERTPADLGSLLSAIEIYQQEVLEVVEAVQHIRDLRQGGSGNED
jgi:hypothetical protein